MAMVRAATRVLAVALVVCAGASAGAEEGFIQASKVYTVRDAPQTGAKAVGKLQVGDKVLVLSRASGWVQVQGADVVGWIGETWVGTEPPTSVNLGPLQEKLSGLETGRKALEEEKARLQEENTRLTEKSAAMEKSLQDSKKAVSAAYSTGHFRDMALGGGLVIAGWLAGYALGTRRRGGGRIRLE